MKFNYKKILIVGIMILIILLCLNLCSCAHSGRTDKYGGHKDNKNVSGLGSYHYHCGGNPPHLHENGKCPYSSNSSSSSSKAKSNKSSGSSNKSSTSTSKINSYSSSSANNTNISSPDINQNKNIEVESVEVYTLYNKLKIGEEIIISKNVSPSNATDKTVTWSSSNEDILKVDSEGKVKSVSEGSATITAKTKNGKTDSITINVERRESENAVIKESINNSLDSERVEENKKTSNILVGIILIVTVAGGVILYNRKNNKNFKK